MNRNKAIEQAKAWLNQAKMPPELDPTEVEAVLDGLGFILKGKNSDHTTYRWYHERLKKYPDRYLYGIVKISLGHAKDTKKVVRFGSVRELLRALEIYMEAENG